ncbi:MAG: DUF6308 family protein, partial [Cellulosimicrobium funkei]
SVVRRSLAVVGRAARPRPPVCGVPRGGGVRGHDRALHRHLVSLRDEAGIGDDISALRVFDVVVWMHHRYLVPTADSEVAR